MVKVGLWCIQDELPLHPSMKSVVLMLEGRNYRFSFVQICDDTRCMCML